jgi:intein/homing endonuclease
LTLRPGEVAEHLPVVERQVVKLLTKSGYFVRVGDTHPILRPDFTYTAAGLLKTGDYVGVVRSLPFFKPRPGSLSPDECELLGLLVGDGGLTKGVTFTNIDEDVLARLSALVAPFRCHLNQYGDSISYSIIGDVPHENPLLQWLRAEETFGKKGRDKTVPPKVFLSGTVGAVAFLGGLLATDGTVDKHTVSWATSSEVMAGEVKHLLLRLGVVGSIVERSSYTGLNWSIDVTAQEQHEQLLALLPYVACERKRDKITRLTKRSLRRKRHNDGIPWSRQLEDEINQARPKASNGSPGGGWPGMWNGFSVSKLFRRTGAISRHLLRTLAEKLSAPSLLKWANSEVRWERLTVIEPEGIKPCSDVTITRHHNFVVGDFITHNSGKTWVLASLIASAYAQEKRLAIYTKEMTPDGIYMRALACILALDYAELRGAVLGRNKPMNKNDEDRIRELHNFLTIDSCGANAITVLNGREAGPGMDTVPWLRSKIERYKPDVVFVDGLYLLSDHLKHTSDQQRVMNISRGLRETILATNTPIIATTQANRKAAGHKEANLDEIGFSDSLGQDVTLAARVINDKTSPTMSLVIGGSREFALHGIRLNNIPAKDFSFHSILTEEDIQKATENDQGEEEKKEKKAKKPKKGDKTTNADREAKEKEAEEHHINNLQNGVV